MTQINLKQLAISICTLLLSSFSYAQKNINQPLPKVKTNPIAEKLNYNKIDTNLVFNTIFELSKYSSKIMLDFDQYSRKEAAVQPNKKYALDSLKYHNIEMFCILQYKNLKSMAKTSAELHSLYYVVNSTTSIGSKELQSLFMEFPKSLRESPIGLKIQNRISLKFANRGKNITAYLPQTIKNQANVTIPFPNLATGKQTTLLILGASWCAPCRFNDERIVRLIKNKQINPNIRIIDISIEKNYSEWIKSIAYKKEIKEHYLTLNEQNEKLYKDLGAHGVPFYFIVNPDMTIAIQGNILDEILPYLYQSNNNYR